MRSKKTFSPEKSYLVKGVHGNVLAQKNLWFRKEDGQMTTAT